MKNLYLLGALLMFLIGNAQCITNGDFEGNISGLNGTYTFRTAQTNDAHIDCHIDTQAGYGTLAPSTTLDNIMVGAVAIEGVTLVSTTSIAPYGINDPYLFNNGITGATASVPRVNPLSGGNFAIKLNGNAANTSVVTMTSNITPTSSVISFDFSLIFELHGADDEEAFFTARVYNSNNEIINLNEICYKANADNNIFDSRIINGRTTLFTNWQCGRIEIPSEYINQPLRLEFVVTDCSGGAHFGTAYLDNIRCQATCSSPAFGLLTLDQVNVSCPESSFEVCGDFVPPANSNLVPGSLQLDLTQNDIVITTLSTTPVVTGNNFCFTVNSSQLETYSGNFEFRVNADFLKPAGPNSPAYTYNLFDASTSEGSDLILAAIDPTTATFEPGGFLSWPDVGDSYELQFVSDGLCCPEDSSGYDDRYFYTTVNENQFDLGIALTALQAKCFRWRIKSICGGWSDWCCISAKERHLWPYGYGNILAPDCYIGDLSCVPTLYADISLPDSGNFYSFEQREISITAVNTLAAQTRAVYQAGHFIELSPGFSAQSGSFLLAEIENCGTTESMAIPKANRKAHVEHIDIETNNLSVDLTLVAYPNPTNGILNIEAKSGVVDYIITDVTGKPLLNFTNNKNLKDFSIDISSLSPGIYLLQANGYTAQKIIKK